MKYKIIENMDGELVIYRTDADDTTSMFFIDEASPNYQQYLIDTDGGLPLPKSKDK